LEHDVVRATAEPATSATSGVAWNFAVFQTPEERPFGVRLEHVMFQRRMMLTS
jgi:hypothetical protein